MLKSTNKLRLSLCALLFVSISQSYAIKEPLVAPYVDVTRMKGDYLVNIHRETGLSGATLAFAIAGNDGCQPHWGGEAGIENKDILSALKNFQNVGGKVIVSTGGAMGPYLEASCTSPAALAAAYKKVLTLVGTDHLDIDIEATIGLDNMNAALKLLQTEMPSLTVSFTLMIQGDDYGLNDPLGVEVLRNAAKHGVNVDIVNAMTMEFGTKLSDWGQAVILAAESVHTQMQQVWKEKSSEELYTMLGVTPMIGRNFNGKIFEVKHAHDLVAWAKSKKIGHLAFWSIGRDNGKCPGGGVSPDCSSIAQSEWEFTKIFQQYADTKIPDDHRTTPKPDHHTDHTDHTKQHQSTTKKPHPVIDCSVSDRHYPHETDCDKYYWCYQGTAHLEQCPSGTVWDPKINACNFREAAKRTDCV